MKTIYQLICAICVICGICACEDFLDTDNLTMKDTSNFPINETDATQMVNGIYSVMNRNLADPEEDPFFVFDIASDDRLGGGSQSNIGAQGVDRLMNAYVDWMKPLWKQRYAGINRANNALETIDKVTEWSSPDKKNQLLCEIYFLRAWYFFNLAQVFNGVPLVLSYHASEPAEGYTRRGVCPDCFRPEEVYRVWPVNQVSRFRRGSCVEMGC